MDKDRCLSSDLHMYVCASSVVGVFNSSRRSDWVKVVLSSPSCFVSAQQKWQRKRKFLVL